MGKIELNQNCETAWSIVVYDKPYELYILSPSCVSAVSSASKEPRVIPTAP
jgi:hypothetical protein